MSKKLNELDLNEVSGGMVFIERLNDGSGDYDVYSDDPNFNSDIFQGIECAFTDSTAASIRAEAVPQLINNLLYLGISFQVIR